MVILFINTNELINFRITQFPGIDEKQMMCSIAFYQYPLHRTYRYVVSYCVPNNILCR